MIQDQLQTSESHETETKLDLTVEESFFIELMEKLEPSVINIKYMKNEVQLVKIEQFLNYYSEKEIIQLLESLVTKGRIKKNDKGVVLLCPKCGGHAIMTLLLCPRCGSVKIGKRVDLYHAECEYWGQKEEFVEGLLLRCPRCNELLDEDAPEGTPGFYSVSDTNFECQDCGTSVSKNNLKMVCLKCNTKFSSSQTHYLNSVSYALVPEDQITLPKPKKSKPRSPPIEKPVMVKPEKSRKEPEPKKEPEPDSFTEKTKTENITDQEQEQQKTEVEPEPEIEKKPKKKPKPKKKKQENEILQKSISRVSKLLKPKKKRKKKSKSKPKRKPVPEPVEETQIEAYGESQEVSETHLEEPEFVEEKLEPVIEEKKEPEESREPEAKKVLMIVENVTVTEFIIESLEEVKTPIEVLHVDDGRAALKELRNRYDLVIMDLDLQTFESKLILKEIEKWGIMTPIIAFSNDDYPINRYSLNIEASLKKKQSDYRKIIKIIKSL